MGIFQRTYDWVVTFLKQLWKAQAASNVWNEAFHRVSFSSKCNKKPCEVDCECKD